MIEIEDDGGCDADGGEEGVCAAVVAGRDAPPILEPSEHVLDLVSGFVERLVVGDGCLSALGWRDARGDALGREDGTEAVAVVPPVGDENRRVG